MCDPPPPPRSPRNPRTRFDSDGGAPYAQGSVRRAVFSVLPALFCLLVAGSSWAAPASTTGGGTRLRAVVPAGPPPAIMPLAAVKPGMVGEALTVFQGTKPEPFKVRVVSVLRNFLPKQDVILVRAEDPRVEHSGIVAGMSGSPVYIDGKLVGAIAYAWSFAKEPLGGVTPIETMLSERQRPRRSGKEVLAEGWSPPGTSGKSGRRFVNTGPGIPRALAPQSEGPAARARGLGLPPTTPTMATGEPRLLRASVPLSVSGFTARTVAELSDALAPTGLVPLQAGGGRKPGPAAAGH